MWVICDGDCKIVSIAGLKMFGVMTTILACFTNESDALNVLFEMENAELVKDHTVRHVTELTGIL